MAWVSLVLGLLAVPAAAVTPLGAPVRFAILLAFVCFAPGAAFTCLIRLGDRVSSWAMAFILSVALAGGLADVMLWTDLWHPIGGYVVLAVPTVATSMLALLPSWRRGVRSSAAAGPAEPGHEVRSDATTLLPRIAGSNSGSAAGGMVPFLDSTVLLPKIADRPALDETIMLPMTPHIDDATTILPAISDVRRPDDTVIMRLPQARQPPPDEVLMGEAAASEVEPDEASAGVGRWRGLRPLLAEAGIIAVILAVWLFSLSRTSADSVGDYGLLSVIHPAYFVAVALCALRFIVELARKRWRGWILLAHTVVLIAIMHATVPLLVYEPEYAWSYKHVGVVEHIRAYGVVTNALDIYQQWPTLFAFVAHLVDGSGVDALRLAAWAPVFFDLAFCVPLFAIARTLSTDRRVPYLTVFLFSAANWVAQDYLSPQAFTYVLGLGTLLIMVRWLRRTTGRPGRTPERIARLWAWVGSGLAEVPYTSKYASRAVVVVLYIVYAVVVASHQLSPYLIAMTACGLVALGLVRPLRIVPALLTIAVLYLVPRYQIAEHYGLFDFDVFGHATSAGPVEGTTAGRVLSAQVVQFLSLTVWALAALGVVASWRRPGPIAAPAVLAFSPFGLLLAQSYGGEAIYRVYLFSIPWCAYLIATLVLRKRWLPRGVGVPGAALVVTAAVLASMQGAHGQLLFNRFTPDEVAASTFIYTHAEPGADIVLAASNFPTRLTANYDKFSAGANGDHGLLPGNTDLARLKLTEADLPKINSYFSAKTPTYLVFSPAMSKYLHYFGYVPDGLVERLKTTISGSPNWRVYFQNHDVTIYKYYP
ncbi:MAG: hypothetical protein QOE61_2523 [Micromonosporaceae bacterium]|nr:hypothetical protein [Micromonosporaceae bacterium]